jgi:uncharacterized membrane protein
MTTDEPLEAAKPENRLRGVMIAALSLVAMVSAATGWVYSQLPAGARVPMHWNASGEIDGYGGAWSIWMLPATMLGICLLLSALPSIEPRRGHLLRSSRAYGAVWLAVVTMLGAMQVVVLATVRGHAIAMNLVALVGLGGVLIVVGNYLGKVRSNFVFGVRTPWTLSSELSWNKANRFCGRFFVVAGIAMVAMAVCGLTGPAFLIAAFGALIAGSIITVVYSYVVWRHDPHRQI